MTKTYNSPTLQIVSIKRNDIVTGSPMTAMFGEGTKAGGEACAPDRFNSWYEGY